jgi:multiple antibiotic resistance protein
MATALGTQDLKTFLLVLAAIFPVVNPPGSALVFLSITRRASSDTRRFLARRVALNSFFVMTGSLLLGTFILDLYGISVPIIRVAGGIVVAAAGWKLLNQGSQKEDVAPEEGDNTDYRGMAFYPLTLPITTGPGTIAVMISLGFTRASYASTAEELLYVGMILLAAIAIAVAIYVCFAYADRAERILGHTGTDIAVRLSAFILFCIGVQILWSGAVELWASLPAHAPSPAPLPAPKAGGA